MKRTLLMRGLLILGAIVWLFAVTFAYYIVHKPFGADNLLAIFNALGDVFVAVLIFLLALLIGRRILRAFNFMSPIQSLVVSIGVGLGLISFATLGLGIIGALNIFFFWGLLVALLLIWRKDFSAIRCDIASIRLSLSTRLDRVLALFCGLTLFIAFLYALMPPTSWDAQVYHLQIPKTAIAQGRITTPPDLLYFSFPSLVEMLYLAAMLLKGDIVPQLIHMGYMLLTLLALYDFASRYFNASIAWMACAILCAVPSLMLVASWAYVDFALVFYATVALIVLIDVRTKDDWRWYALVGVFAGLAMGIKYTSAIVPVALMVIMLLSKESRRWSFVIAHWSFAVLVAAPWYLRNLILMGNPVYPFIFGGAYWDSFRADWFGRFGTGLADSPLRLLIAPWDATINGIDGTINYDATIGPLLLLFIPMIAIVFFKRKEPDARLPLLRDALIFSAILYLFWLAGIAQSKLLLQTRLLFPVFPVLALLAAVAFDHLRELDMPQFSLHRFATLLVLLILLLTGSSYGLAEITDNPLTYVIGAQSRETYLKNHLAGYWAAIQFINTQLPANARILFWWEPRSYYAARTVQPESDLDLFAHARYLYHDANSIAAALRQQGYTHILIARGGLDYVLQNQSDPISGEDMTVLQTFASGYLRQVYGDAPLEIITHDGKLAVRNAANDPYAIYEWAQ